MWVPFPTVTSFLAETDMWEKLLVPLALVLLYVILSGAVMVGVRGNTSRMNVIFQAATVFVAAMVYSMAWHLELSSILGFSQAWILTTLLGAVGAVGFAIRRFREADRRSDSSQVL
jgi:hypothetical protein